MMEVLITIIQGFCKEVLWWKSLRHPNVHPLLAATMNGGHFAMISQWMENGNIKEFIEKNGSENRFELVGLLPAVNYAHR